MLSRRLRIRASALIVGSALCATMLLACGAESAAEVCARGPIFDSARQRAERAVAEFDRTTTIELEESVTSMVDQLLLLREISPRELRDPLGVLLAAYGQLVVALNDTAWNPQVAATDPTVASARSAFAETSVAEATDEVRDFFDQQCAVALGESNPLFAITGTTLPLPEVSEEPSLDAEEAPVVSDSELQAIGFLLGETYGVALLASEAECVARSLGVTLGEVTDVSLDDAQFFAKVTEVFTSCGVATPPTTTPDN